MHPNSNYIKDQSIKDQCQKQRPKNGVTLRPFLCEQSLNENSSPSLHKHSRLLILMCLSVSSEAADNNETARENGQPAVVQQRFGDGQINHFKPDSSPVQTAEQTFWLIKRNSTHR